MSMSETTITQEDRVRKTIDEIRKFRKAMRDIIFTVQMANEYNILTTQAKNIMENSVITTENVFGMLEVQDALPRD